MSGEVKGWPLQSVFVATVYAARGPYTRLKIGAGSRRCKPEVETNEWYSNTSRKTLDRVEQMNSYYEKHSPRAQRSVTLIIPHANTPLGPVGPIPSSPVPSSPGSEAETQTAPALLLLSFLLGRRTTSTSPPRRHSTPATR